MTPRHYRHLITPERARFQKAESRAGILAWLTLFLFAAAEIILSRI